MTAVSPVAALIEESQATFLHRHGVELKQADIARKSGLSSQRISQLMNEPVKAIPPRSSIEALAKGIGVSYDVALQAFLEATGYEDPEELPRAARKGTPVKSQGKDEQGV